MWNLLKNLPLEVSSYAVLPFLTAKDIVFMERAIVARRQLEILFTMVRAGPSLNLHLQPFYHSKLNWLRKNQLKIRQVTITDGFMKEALWQLDELHRHVDGANISEISRYPQLCDKANALMAITLMTESAWLVSPATYLRKLQNLHVVASNCQHSCSWMQTLPCAR
jgi:hypothetical protein